MTTRKNVRKSIHLADLAPRTDSAKGGVLIVMLLPAVQRVSPATRQAADFNGDGPVDAAGY
jgi:hypothetical protein